MLFPLIVPPQPALRPWIHHIIVMGYQAASVSPIPAVLNPNIILFPRGSGFLEAPDGCLTPLPRACLKGPCLEPRQVHCAPHSVFISILFRIGVMPDALGPAVGEFRNQVTPLEGLVSPLQLMRMLERMDEEASPLAWVDLAQDFLIGCLRARRHAGRMALSLADLFQPAGALADGLDVSVRQLERRMDQAYGANLRDVRRMVRFGYCFARLTTASLRRGDLTKIAQDFGYYDQSHMDRDFRELAGSAPGLLLDAAANNDPGQWLYRLGERNFHHLFLTDDVDSVQETLLSRS